MRRIYLFSKKYSFLLFIALNILCYLILHFAVSDGVKVEIRQALTTKSIQAPNVFLAPPDSLAKFGFKTYSKFYLNSFLSENRGQLRQFYRPNATKNTIEKAKEIALSFSKNGGKGCGTYSRDLIKNIEWTSTGGGCCSDHAQVFIALCLLNGIYAREVNHISHTFNEFWDDKEKKWIWIDPQYCLLAKDSLGNFLSLLQIRETIKEKGSVNWAFFGTPYHEFYKKDPDSHLYYQPDQFESIILTMGNRVFLEDTWNKKLPFAPRDLRQTLLIVTGVHPKYQLFGVNSNYSRYLSKVSKISILVIAFYIIANLYFIIHASRKLYRRL